LSGDCLRDAVRVVLADPAYRARAGRLRTSIEAADGLSCAADLIEGEFGGRTVPETVVSRDMGSASERVGMSSRSATFGQTFE
jgi:hypothetical protein